MYYTSYFGYIKNLPKNYKLASITYKKPKFCDDTILDGSFLGPSKELLDDYKKSKIDEKGYTIIYNKFLDDNGLKFKDFLITHQKENIVFLCYEKPPKFCHRHLLAKFLNAKGIKCQEVNYNGI